MRVCKVRERNETQALTDKCTELVLNPLSFLQQAQVAVVSSYFRLPVIRRAAALITDPNGR